mgnify:CR=1 FL=1
MVRIQIANQTGTAEALLNDTVAARDFARRLPCTLVAVPVEDGYEAVTAKGCYDPMESVDHFASLYGAAESCCSARGRERYGARAESW